MSLSAKQNPKLALIYALQGLFQEGTRILWTSLQPLPVPGRTSKGVSYRAAVAFQVPTQAKGSGGRKRLSARGGAAYGTPRNWLMFLHSEPMWITWDLPIRSPWDGMYTDGIKSDSEMGRNKSVRAGGGGGWGATQEK